MIKSKYYDNLHNKTLGNRAEGVVKSLYLKRGYKLSDTNFRTRNSEIDLVFYSEGIEGREGGEVIIFVEVKCVEIGEGLNKNNIKPEDNFTKNKQKMFGRGIEQYLFKNKIKDIQIQIDLACVYRNVDRVGETDEWRVKIYENIILE